MRTLLNSLAIAQSSAVAIVASVTLLNVQLVADRYSTELVRSALPSSPFKTVLFAFIAAIAFGLILVYNIVNHSAVWFTAAVVAAAVWALINAYVLYRFIFNSVGVLTPSSLITTITGYEPAELADQTTPVRDPPVETAPSDNNDQEQPLYQLYIIISSSVGKIDYHVVPKGLYELRSLLEEVIEDLEQPAGAKLCQNAFQYYPRIVEQCLRNAEIEQAELAVRDLTSLLETLETKTNGWHSAHFAGIQALFRIRDETTDETLIDDETIPARLEHCPGPYWTDDRLEYVLTRAEAEMGPKGSQEFWQELSSRTHASVIDSKRRDLLFSVVV